MAGGNPKNNRRLDREAFMKCSKEKIFVDNGNGGGVSLTYYLSNSLDDVKEAVYSITGCSTDLTDDFSEIYWRLNHELSESVKDLMNRHNVDYSMTLYDGIIVNRRFGGSWYIYMGINIDGGKNFYSREKFIAFEAGFP
jgi:hypothetical protein